MSPHRVSNSTTSLIIAAVAAVVFLLDQWTKRIVMHDFMPGVPRIVIPHLLRWTYERNFHGAFGYFGDNKTLLIGMALIVLVIFWISFREAARHSRLICVAFGLIVGGAAGNIFDRFHQGFVVDFIDFYRIWPNIFNIADSCVTIGVALLLLSSLATRRRA